MKYSKHQMRVRGLVFYIRTMLKTLFRMTRPVNIVIAVVTLVVGDYLTGELPCFTNLLNDGQDLCLGGTTLLALVLQALGFTFAIGFGNIQNDVLDFESDKKNRPERSLPSGSISLAAAKRAWIIMLILSILCGVMESASWFINPHDGYAFIPALFFVLLATLLIAYNIKLKHIPLLKNMTVAFLCMTPLLFVLIAPSTSNYLEIEIDDDPFFIYSIINPVRLYLLYPAMMFAFLLTTAREIYKDLEDQTGDLKAGIMTFPLIAGAPTARRLAGAILLFTWILLPFPVMQGFYPRLFLILALVTLTPTFIFILAQAHRGNYRKAQNTVKIAMFAGLMFLVISNATM